MNQNLSDLYEKYHKKTKLQKKVIGKKNFTYRLILDSLEPYLGCEERILDVGCGAGTLCFYLAARGKIVLGVDISQKAIQACMVTANKLGLKEKTDFQVGDFLKKKIDSKFTFIILSEVLEHIRNEDLAIKKLWNLLESNGKLLISVPSHNSPLFNIGFALQFDHEVGHLRRYSLKNLLILLEKRGFKILRKKKTEGVLRNFLFISKWGSFFIKAANRFTIVSDIFTFLDNISLKFFGESQIIVVAQKPERSNERKKK